MVLSPLNWLFVLLIAGCFLPRGKRRKAALIAALCIYLFFGNEWLLNVYARTWQTSPKVLSATERYSCVIVAGGFASPDEEDRGYFNSAADRFIQVLKLYKTGHVNHILISGGNGKPEKKEFQEAAWVKTQLVEMGVPGTIIFTEDHSKNTFDNATNAQHILDSLQLAPPYLLVTSAYHMPRASLIFKKAGVDVVPFPCNYTAGRGNAGPGDFFPSVSVLPGWNDYLKETLGYFWYRMKG